MESIESPDVPKVEPKEPKGPRGIVGLRNLGIPVMQTLRFKLYARLQK